MQKEYVTLKVWNDTRKFLRLISAFTGEQIVEVIHKMARAEWEKLQREQVTQVDSNK
jgi:hypothetical protein